MPINKKDLAKLSPAERLKRLKQIEQERKKEILEIEGLIKDSMKEMKIEKLAEEITPEHREVDISRLFASEEGGLEGTAAEAHETERAGVGYQGIVQMYQDYSRLKEFYSTVAGGGELTREQLASIGSIGERLNIAEKYMTESEKTASKLDPSRTILYKLKKETGIE